MRIGIIGCGNMGSALIHGMVKSRRFPSRQILAWDPDTRRLSGLTRRYKIRRVSSNSEVAEAEIVLLAVKPQQMEEVLQEVRPSLNSRKLLISIAAGRSTDWIGKRVNGKAVPVVRVMPNMPASVQKGVSAIAGGKHAKAAHLEQAEKIFRSIGDWVVCVPEKLMDAVTAVSGSGPAYFFFLMEEMIRQGIALGLPDKIARRLVLETAAGAAALAKETEEEPSALRARVTSKGGTTEAAFRVFSQKQVGENLRAGIHAAYQRAKEMSA